MILTITFTLHGSCHIARVLSSKASWMIIGLCSHTLLWVHSSLFLASPTSYTSPTQIGTTFSTAFATQSEDTILRCHFRNSLFYSSSYLVQFLWFASSARSYHGTVISLITGLIQGFPAVNNVMYYFEFKCY